MDSNIREVLSHILPDTTCYQAGFCLFSIWGWSGIPCLFSLGSHGYEPHDAILCFSSWCLPFCLQCFLFLHLAPSIFLHDSNKKFLWNPWWHPLPQMHFASFSCSFPSICILTRVMFTSVAFNKHEECPFHSQKCPSLDSAPVVALMLTP